MRARRRLVTGALSPILAVAHRELRATLHGDDRFPMCSTFKLLAAAVLMLRPDLRVTLVEQEPVLPPASRRVAGSR